MPGVSPKITKSEALKLERHIKRVPAQKKVFEYTQKSPLKNAPSVFIRSLIPIRVKKICPKCLAELEIDDRAECVFDNPDNLKLPMNGNVCRVSGLVQSVKRDSCGYCGAEIFVNNQ